MTLTEEERARLRRHIAENIVGDDPPPLTAEAQELIRVMLGPVHTGESVTA